MDNNSSQELKKVGESPSREELNSWRRGFTPQAEIWNGRMAMFGLGIGLAILILVNIIVGN